jgi:3-keto-L-gulonate-6-phosphate decarboxylase
MDVVYGKELLSSIIQATDSASVDSVFYHYNIDVDQVHYQWVDTLMKMNNIYEY